MVNSDYIIDLGLHAWNKAASLWPFIAAIIITYICLLVTTRRKLKKYYKSRGELESNKVSHEEQMKLIKSYGPWAALKIIVLDPTALLLLAIPTMLAFDSWGTDALVMASIIGGIYAFLAAIGKKVRHPSLPFVMAVKSIVIHYGMTVLVSYFAVNSQSLWVAWWLAVLASAILITLFSLSDGVLRKPLTMIFAAINLIGWKLERLTNR